MRDYDNYVEEQNRERFEEIEKRLSALERLCGERFLLGKQVRFRTGWPHYQNLEGTVHKVEDDGTLVVLFEGEYRVTFSDAKEI